MIGGFWGKKIGMTQLFSDNKVIPVTVVDVSSWYITDIKTKERDGYCALQVARARKRYEKEEFSHLWLKNKKAYFVFIKEVPLSDEKVDGFEIGKIANFAETFSEGDIINVTGTTKGCGFAGVMRRHNFAGGKDSHGSMMGKRPGSIGFIGKSGKVVKGKKLPGHMGVDTRTMQNLKMIKIMPEQNVIAIKGSVPGKAGSLVFVRRVG